jgi:ribulose-phosphate 3-epimerase
MVAERPILISPSILSADFANLERDLRRAEAAGADWHHVDVMDGHFVPNLTIGPPVVKAVKRAAGVPLDVHLMIDHPLRYAEAFCDAGADWLTFHVESKDDPLATAAAIRGRGARVGVTLNPDTPVSALGPLVGLADMVLVMSVFPGFAGQSFIPESLERVREVRERLGFTGDVEIDGGIAEDTIADAAAAGANVFVAGTAIYRHEKGVEHAVSRLRALAAEGCARGR